MGVAPGPTPDAPLAPDRPRPYRDWIDLDLALLARCDGLVRLPGPSAGADAEVAWCVEHGVPVHRLPLAWGSTTALVRLRSWLDDVPVVGGKR